MQICITVEMYVKLPQRCHMNAATFICGYVELLDCSDKDEWECMNNMFVCLQEPCE